MLPEQKTKEEFSFAYVHAVAASKSFIVNYTRIDYDSIDVSISSNGLIEEDSSLYSPEIKLQMKATASPTFKENHLHFKLPIKNYNELRAKVANPRILVVLCIPEDQEEWLSHTCEELVLRKCAYYMSLKGMAETDNEYTVTIHIPLKNVFSPDALYEMMLKTSKEEDL